jgi:Mrp family chromosome partitioning ATPase
VLARLEELERQYPTVVVAAPALDRFPTHALLSTSRLVVLVADEGRLSPAELRSTLHTLARLNVPVGGVVLEGHENGARV